MIDLNPVRYGITAANRFATALINDLDPHGGGFKRWQHELEPADAEELADYVVGSVQAAGFGLQAAGTALNDYLEWRSKQDSAVRLNMTDHGTPYAVPPDQYYDERELRLNLNVRDCFISCGSVLDGLTASLIGVLGLALDIHHASFRDFRPQPGQPYPNPKFNKSLYRVLQPVESSAGTRQRADLSTFASVLESAGPYGWHDWLSGMRNVALHRENRNEVNSTEHDKQKGWYSQRMLTSNPELSNLQGIRTGQQRLANMHLHEDARTTLSGCVGSVNATAVATIDLLERTWERRRQDPTLIVQPAKQWSSLPTGSRFAGYDPGSAEIGKRAQIHAHPLDLHRLRAGGLLN